MSAQLAYLELLGDEVDPAHEEQRLLFESGRTREAYDRALELPTLNMALEAQEMLKKSIEADSKWEEAMKWWLLLWEEHRALEWLGEMDEVEVLQEHGMGN